ncbi:MAG: hypothetical protein IPG96_02950 [Proteobacteria bacterium]|nr:hypothetical protein [Pseudomonadota bacterium]
MLGGVAAAFRRARGRWWGQRRVWAWLVLLALGTVALRRSPLFAVPGYELGLLLALVGSLAGAHLGSIVVAVARAERSDPAAPAPTLPRLVARAVAWALLVLVPPLLIALLNGVTTRLCDLGQGLAFYALLPGLSAPLAATVGVLCGLCCRRPARATTAALLVVVASFGVALFRFYATPALFAYGPFFGYVAGPLYDEVVAVQPALLFARAEQLAWTAAVCAAAMHAYRAPGVCLALPLPRWQRRASPALLALLLVAGALSFTAPRLGVVAEAATITTALGGLRQTPHFTLVYPRELSAAQVDRLAADHEFRYAQLATRLGTTPGRVRAYLFRSAAEKRALIGGGGVFVAKPWRREIYMIVGDVPLRALGHELAHVFAATAGDPLLGISVRWSGWGGLRILPQPNLGLVEGFAVAVADLPEDELTVHQRAATLLRLGLAPPLERLLGVAFLATAGARGYALAGSFCRHLLERFGAARLLALYRSGGDFQASYGQSLGALAEPWRRRLAALALDPRQLAGARRAFARPAIFARACPHEVANLLVVATQALQRGGGAQAVPLLRRACALDPASAPTALVWVDAVEQSTGPAPALALLERLAARGPLGDPGDPRAPHKAGDLLWSLGRTPAAHTRYALAAARATAASERRLLTLKRLALDQSGERRELLRRYLLPSPTPVSEGEARARAVHLAHELARAWPSSGLGFYLVGRQLASTTDGCADALAPLERALALGLPDDDFVVEALLISARCATWASQLDRAARAFAALRTRQGRTGAALLEQVADGLARLRWLRSGSATLGRADPARRGAGRRCYQETLR